MLSTSDILQERYQIIRLIGKGGMGVVYEAKDLKRFGQEVALKEILLSSATNPSPQSVNFAFEREAKILTRLEHEAFPKVIDYFFEKDKQYLVMELIKGDDFSELLKTRQNPFSPEDIFNWADQLLDALDYIHSQVPPVVHRDIKPQNLKLNRRGRIKLLDFGIAKSSEVNAATVANQTFLAATMNYSPIEQIFPTLDVSVQAILAYQHNEIISEIEKRTATPRSDLYSLGATLYHFSTNQLPIDSLKRSIEIWDGKPDPLPNPQTLNSSIPMEFSAWLLKAMEIYAEDRPSSAGEMRKTLQEISKAANRRSFNQINGDSYSKDDALSLTENRLNLDHSASQTIPTFFSNHSGESGVFPGNEILLPETSVETEEKKLQPDSINGETKHQVSSQAKTKKIIPILLALVPIIFAAVIAIYLVSVTRIKQIPATNSNTSNNENGLFNAGISNAAQEKEIKPDNTAIDSSDNLQPDNKIRKTSKPIPVSSTPSPKDRTDSKKSVEPSKRKKPDKNCIFNDDCE